MTVVASSSSRRGRRGNINVPTKVVVLASAPALVFLIATFGLPIALTIGLSFSKWEGLGAPKWTGLRNYRGLFTNPDFFHSIRVSFIYTISSTIGIVATALFMAVAVSRRSRGDKTLRAVWFLPSIAPAVAIAVFWSITVQPTTGIVNSILGGIGLGSHHAWLASPDTAIFVIIFITIWSSAAFPFLLLLGAIDRVPAEVYEAARIDGAGDWEQMSLITLPLIQPVLAMVTVLELIWTFNAFTPVWATTKGGPADSTSTLPVMLYKLGFQNSDFGSAAAIGVLGSVFLLAIGMISLRLVRTRTEDL